MQQGGNDNVGASVGRLGDQVGDFGDRVPWRGVALAA
jgi:hypothetical protein